MPNRVEGQSARVRLEAISASSMDFAVLVMIDGPWQALMAASLLRRGVHEGPNEAGVSTAFRSSTRVCTSLCSPEWR